MNWEKWGRRDVGNWVEYKLHPTVAQLVKELRLGLNGEMRHSWRAVAIKVTGQDCQQTGVDLCRLAQWALEESWEEGI